MPRVEGFRRRPKRPPRPAAGALRGPRNTAVAGQKALPGTPLRGQSLHKPSPTAPPSLNRPKFYFNLQNTRGLEMQALSVVHFYDFLASACRVLGNGNEVFTISAGWNQYSSKHIFLP